MPLFRLLLIFFLVYFLLNKVIRPFLSVLLGRTDGANRNKSNTRYSSSYGQQQQYKDKKKGRISILKKGDKYNDKDDFKGGEYVDYEEVE